MVSGEFQCLILSDFNAANLSGYLSHDTDSPKVNAILAPYGQVVQVMMEKNSSLWNQGIDVAVIWTQPQNLIESFNDMLHYKSVPLDKILEEVDMFSSLIMNIRDKAGFLFVPAWTFPSYHRGFGMLDMKNGIGIANTLMRMNLRLSENLDKASNIYVLDTQRWVQLAGGNAFHTKLWYMGKIPFSNEVFKESVRDIKSALRGVSGNAKKVVLLDMDDTLWGGIVGDVGWENIKLGGHDPIGEAFADFQKELKSLTNRGIILGVVSKNEESVVLEAMRNHPEMILRPEDLAGWRINWNDKAQNISDLLSELNLVPQSAVFIDDNPVERARIRDTLPEILVPEWPEDKMLYKKALLCLGCFDTPFLSAEDMERSRTYTIERQRTRLKSEVGSLEEWLKSLDIKVRVEELNETNLSRTVQLLNKTNQMNLSTRRMSEAELLKWVAEKDRKFWTFRVSDKFGDSGLTGLLSLEKEDGRARIVDFILSCRVMGRKVEETMLHVASKYSQSGGLSELYATYLPTPKNKPCLEFWKRSGFIYDESENRFRWSEDHEYPAPEQIMIQTP